MDGRGGRGYPRPPLSRLPLWAASFERTLLLGHLLLGLLLDSLRDGRISQGRGVPELFALGYVLQEPAHDLAGVRLRQILDGVNPVGSADLAGLLGHRAPQLLLVLLVVILPVALEDHERYRRLALVFFSVSVTAASATPSWPTRAFSISTVESRCPETLS